MQYREIGGERILFPVSPDAAIALVRLHNYTEISRFPGETARITYDFLHDFFRGDGDKFSLAGKDFLRTATQDYLKAVKDGYYLRLDQTHDPLLPRDQLDEILAEGKDSTLNPHPKAHEAFFHANVVFARMSVDFFKDKQLHGWQDLKAPRTPIEYLERIKELQREIDKITNGETKPKSFVYANSSVFRTYGFFLVASHMKMVTPESRPEYLLAKDQATQKKREEEITEEKRLKVARNYYNWALKGINFKDPADLLEGIEIDFTKA